jgi:plasmid stabilization system protein ParE
MARVYKREAAKRDLIRQWVWYAENGGSEVAGRFLRAASDTLHLLSAQPEKRRLVFCSQAGITGNASISRFGWV